MQKTDNLYGLPVSEELITLVVEDNESHQGNYKGSIDFAVPIGSPVFAAADGVVTRVRDDSDKYGQEKSFGSDVNYITIKHKNKELSEYMHLAKDSALVKPGDSVLQGQQIAVTGLSGWLYAPHLHFSVYIKYSDSFRCLDVQFRNKLPGSLYSRE